MDNGKKNKVKLLVLNDYLKFDRKIYQLFGISLGRPIKLKSILYFFLFLIIELVIYFTPYIQNLIRWLPAIYLILIPAVLAYIFSGIRTEGRSTVAFFRSLILYHLRKQKDVTYGRGREIKKPRNYRFEGYATIIFAEDRVDFVPRKFKFKKNGKISVTNYMDRDLLKYVDSEMK